VIGELPGSATWLIFFLSRRTYAAFVWERARSKAAGCSTASHDRTARPHVRSCKQQTTYVSGGTQNSESGESINGLGLFLLSKRNRGTEHSQKAVLLRAWLEQVLYSFALFFVSKSRLVVVQDCW